MRDRQQTARRSPHERRELRERDLAARARRRLDTRLHPARRLQKFGLEDVMLLVAIITLVLALVVGALPALSGVGAGALWFAAGFLLIAAIATLREVRSRKPTVF